jgi:hypothetical protein
MFSIFAHNAAVTIEHCRLHDYVELRMAWLTKLVEVVLAETAARSPV